MMRNLRHWNTLVSKNTFDSQGEPGFGGGGLGEIKTKRGSNVIKIIIFNALVFGIRQNQRYYTAVSLH